MLLGISTRGAWTCVFFHDSSLAEESRVNLRIDLRNWVDTWVWFESRLPKEWNVWSFHYLEGNTFHLLLVIWVGPASVFSIPHSDCDILLGWDCYCFCVFFFLFSDVNRDQQCQLKSTAVSVPPNPICPQATLLLLLSGPCGSSSLYFHSGFNLKGDLDSFPRSFSSGRS